MSYFAKAATAAAAAAFVCGIALGHAGAAPLRLAAEKIDSEKLEKRLQDTRETIQKDRASKPSGNATTNQFAIDICKKNPKLPQCKL